MDSTTTTDRHLDMPPLIAEHMDLLACPACGGRMETSDADRSIQCADCVRSFSSEDGVPQLFWPHDTDSDDDVTEIVKAFYEETPFPNYDDVDSEQTLREKAERGIFARLLDEQIPHGATVLEVGCGTGQLSNFLGLKWGRSVFGADMCLNSLKLGQGFKRRNEIDNVAFVQMNLFRPVFRPEGFDLVICNGVLHHTSDPFGGFQSISRLVKPGGHILIGLYNTYGRIPTDVRRIIFSLTGGRLAFLDPRMRDESINDTRKQTWFADQYRHPHESKHTMGEVIEWFDRTSFEFTNSIPKVTAFDTVAPDERLLMAHSRGTRLDHFISQAGMLLGGGKEGGFFVMIGRKRSD